MAKAKTAKKAPRVKAKKKVAKTSIKSTQPAPKKVSGFVIASLVLGIACLVLVALSVMVYIPLFTASQPEAAQTVGEYQQILYDSARGVR
jgi:flagellar basal body-associated protein FliL